MWVNEEVVGMGIWELELGFGEGEVWGCLGRLKLQMVKCGFGLSCGHPASEQPS